MAAIELQQVSKLYANAVPAVSDVSLDIRDGEFMILLGPSGCGKSTTLRMIAGLESITSGAIYIGGQLMNNVAPRDRNVAVVFQNYALYPHMTVAENLAFGLKMHRRPRREIEERIRAIAAMLDIEALLGRRPAALSGGQRQRVALGRALVRDPAAFLLDEPLSNLDAQLRADMRLELVKLHRKLGVTIVHVTHDQVEAMTMGQRICIMKNGRVMQAGPPLEVYRAPANTFVAGFLGSPPMNLVQARLASRGDGALELACGALTLKIPEHLAPAYRAWRDKPVIFGIRPEDIYESADDQDRHPVDLTVVALEALGAEMGLVASLPDAADTELMARLGRNYQAPVGSSQRLYFDLEEMHLFDPETANVIPRSH